MATSLSGPFPPDRSSVPRSARSPAQTVIEVRELEKSYGPTQALRGVSFAVRQGEVFGILGPNGAGKTTTVEILEGYRRPDRGQAHLLGRDAFADGASLKQEIGVMLQEGGLTPGLRPLELLHCLASFYDDPEEPEQLLTLVGLADARRTTVRRLSGGQAQRLSLACALVGRPSVLFLDEPTAGMDPQARATTWQIVRHQRDLGRTVVLTTHLMDEAEALCDRVAIIVAGEMVALGTPSELTHGTFAEHVSFTAPGGLDTSALAGALGLAVGAVEELRPGEYRVGAVATPDLVAALACWLRDEEVVIGSLHANRRPLEEVFLKLTSEPPT